MNLEQIAKEVRLSMMRDFNGLSKEIDIDVKDETEFLRRCLSKLAEQAGEPVHWRATLDRRHCEFVATARIAGFSDQKVAEQFCAEKRDFGGWIYTRVDLYTEAHRIAAHQRTAEACAKV